MTEPKVYRYQCSQCPAYTLAPKKPWGWLFHNGYRLCPACAHHAIEKERQRMARLEQEFATGEPAPRMTQRETVEVIGPNPATDGRSNITRQRCPQCGSEYTGGTTSSCPCLGIPDTWKPELGSGVDVESKVCYHRRMELQCDTCGRTYTYPAAWAKRAKKHYCSKACHDTAQTQYPPKICIICGKPFKAAKGKQRRYSTCPDPHCRRANKQGARNPNWRGGVTSSRKREMSTKEYRAWRAAVFARDNYTCTLCGKRGGYLQADHIKPWAYFPELRYDVSNGRTLCLKCHRQTFKAVFTWRNRCQYTMPNGL